MIGPSSPRSGLPRRGRRAVRGAIETYRVIVAVVMLGLLFTTLTWLQGRFDRSDLEKSMTLVKSYRANEGGPAILDAIAKRHPAVNPDDVSWSAELMNSCVGHVRVAAFVPAEGGHGSTTYYFDVDATGPSIHPTDPRTIEILEALTATAAAPGKE